MKFAWSGDEDAQPAAGSRKPFYNRFEVFKRMQAERNSFNVNLGDTIYSDTEVGSTLANGVQAVGTHRPHGQGQVAEVPAEPRVGEPANLRGSAAMYNHWDDHEFINDFSRPRTATRDLQGRGGRVPRLPRR